MEASRLLTPVSGCLGDWSENAGQNGVTHTVNPFIGCPIGWSQCGQACYAQHLQAWARKGHTRGDWGNFVYLKTNAPALYVKEVQTRTGQNAIGIFMSSVTEPLPPHAQARSVTRSLLEAMVAEPPRRGLIIQSHTSYAAAPDILEVLQELSKRTSVLVSISIETNREHIRGLQKPCCSTTKRLNAFRILASNGIATQASISPIMPCNPELFADLLKKNGVWRVILDHWEIGDGARGTRTESVGIPQLLMDNGYDTKWCSSTVLDELEPIFAAKHFPGGVGRKEDFFAFIPDQFLFLSRSCVVNRG